MRTCVSETHPHDSHHLGEIIPQPHRQIKTSGHSLSDTAPLFKKIPMGYQWTCELLGPLANPGWIFFLGLFRSRGPAISAGNKRPRTSCSILAQQEYNNRRSHNGI